MGTSSEVSGCGQRSGRYISGCNISAFFQEDGIHEHEDAELGRQPSAIHPLKRQNDRPTGQQFMYKYGQSCTHTTPFPTAGKELLTGAPGGQTQDDTAEMPATWQWLMDRVTTRDPAAWVPCPKASQSRSVQEDSLPSICWMAGVMITMCVCFLSISWVNTIVTILS